MRRISCTLFLYGLAVSLFLTCRQNPINSDNRIPGLYGKIVDTAGTPLSDASVHYIFYTNLRPYDPIVNFVWIQYGLPTARTVTLRVYDPLDRLVITLVNELQAAGFYRVQFNGSGVTNGIYTYRIQVGDSAWSGSFFIRNDDIAQLQQRSALTVSDQNGLFFMSSSMLGIGKRLVFDYGDTSVAVTISDSLTIVLFKAGYQTLAESFRLDPNLPVERTFQMRH